MGGGGQGTARNDEGLVVMIAKLWRVIKATES